MSVVKEQADFLTDMCKLIVFAQGKGFVLTGGELERKPEMQEIYLKTGRSKTMNSRHLKKCAIDLNFFEEKEGTLSLVYDTEKLKEVGQFWEVCIRIIPGEETGVRLKISSF
jgi:hypothetical protein